MLNSFVPIINIWIHGTFPQDFVPQNLHDSAPFEYIVNKYYCPPGLHRVVDLPKKYNYCQLMLKTAETDPEKFPEESLYLFGWSGQLDPADREKGGKELYAALLKLIKEKYQKEAPFIRLITHSHGGNVALAMAKHVAEKHPDFFVDELILLGTPVHKATAAETKSPLFKKIFSIHSHADIIQTLDPQGLPDLIAGIKQVFVNFSLSDIKNIFKAFEEESFFSGRYFPPHDNLKNIRLQINGRDVFHIEYILPKFFIYLPTIIDALEEKDDAPPLVPNVKGDWLLNIPKKL